MNWRAFFEGVASVSIFQPPIRRTIRRTYFKDDAEALRHDWKKVGEDMRRAMKRVEQERKQRGAE